MIRRSGTIMVLALVSLAWSEGRATAQDVGKLQDEAVRRVGEYLRVNTVNPPGNETRAVDFLARILEAEGIAYEKAESAPGRGNLWATLPGGPGPALILLHHSDVVPADAQYWQTDPLSGEHKDDHIWGRGALDTKALGIVHLQAFLALKHAGRPLSRPVIFMATADEEAGGFFGAGWLVENRPELFRDVGILLNEGGSGSELGGRRVFQVEVTQKVPLWLRLVARDQPGHGSTPRPTSSVGRLVAALERVRTHPFTPRVVPAVEVFLRGRGEADIGPYADQVRNIRSTLSDARFLNRLQAEDPFLAGLLRNTCSITRLEGSSKINVVPPQATAEIDCRLLPDQDPDAFLEELHGIVADSAIEIETIMRFSPAVSSTDTDAYRAIETITKKHFPSSIVLPSVQTGFTDSHFFRDLGIPSYGYAPFLIPPADGGGVHGNNERISVENIRRGTAVMIEIVQVLTQR
jgi:acetylornithine deacetylase/succinyl-diaminopimelate desuccinylase-like protein